MRPSEPGFGALFVNKKKVAGSQQPDYQGTATCCHCNVPVRLAGWNKVAKNSVAYLSLKLQPEGGQGQRSSGGGADDDSCPF